MKNSKTFFGKNKKWILVGVIILGLLWSVDHPVLSAFEECNQKAIEKFYTNKAIWCNHFSFGPDCSTNDLDNSLLSTLRAERIDCANNNPY